MFSFTNSKMSLFPTIRRNVLENYLSDGMDDLGPIKWSLALCVFAVFVLVYFSLWKGVRSTGKVITFSFAFSSHPPSLKCLDQMGKSNMQEQLYHRNITCVYIVYVYLI